MTTDNHCSIILLTMYIIRLLPIITNISIVSVIISAIILLMQLVLSIMIWTIISIIFDVNTSTNTIIGFNELMILYLMLPVNITITLNTNTTATNTMKVLLLSIITSWSFLLALLSSLVYFLDWNETWMIWPIPTLIFIVIGTFIDHILLLLK